MSEKKMTSIGGQAVIEGVMMRGPEKIAVAVRKPDGEIIIDEKENKVKGGVRKIPFVRGIFSFIDSMVIGVQALMFSANFYEEDGSPKKEEEEDPKKEKEKTEKEDSKKEPKETNKENSKNEPEEMPGWMMALTILASLALSIGLFIALPSLIADFVVPINEVVSGDNIDMISGAISGESMSTATELVSGDTIILNTQNSSNRNVVLYNLVESIVKIIIFTGYLLLVSQMRDIQRVFEYHGAEHKTIFCYENGEDLTVENVKKHTRFHPRCGTSFLLFVIIISIIVGSIVFSVIGRFESKIINALIKIALLPIVAGISYEIIRFAGRHTDNKWVSWLNKPGMLLQRLTTREPDEKQIEVAIASLKAVLPKDKNADNW